MNSNRNVLFGLAAGVAGALLLGLFVATSGNDAATAEGPTAAVLVASADLGSNLRVEQVGRSVEEVDAPAALVPARSLSSLDQVEGQRLVRRVSAGEILTLDQFARHGPAPGGVIVPAGYEAMSVEVSPAPGVAGYVTPGARVNVYGVFTETVTDPEQGGQASRSFTQLVLGHVNVLAVTRGTLTGEAREPGREALENRVVLLLQVHPSDVPVLVHSQSQGTLWFTLVNEQDSPPSAERINLADLSPAARSAAIAAVVAQQRADALEEESQ